MSEANTQALNTNEGRRCPSCFAVIPINATKCPKCGHRLKPILDFKDAKQIRLADLNASLVSIPVTVQVQISGEGDKKAIEEKATVSCQRCGEVLDEVNLGRAENFGALVRRVFWGKKAFEKSLMQHADRCECERPRPTVSYGEKYIDYRMLYCRDVVTEKEKFDEGTYRVYDVVVVGKALPIAKKVVMRGVVTVDREDRLLIIVYDVAPIKNIRPENISHKGFDKYFRNNKSLDDDLDKTIANHIVGRPLAKLGAALVIHSPIKLLFEGKEIRGALWGMFEGDTTVGKSEILEWVHRNIGGEFGVGEQSRRTGLLFTVDMDKKIIIWGLLVQADLGLALIDSLQGMDPTEIPALREAQRQQRVKVDMAVKGEALVRTRVLAACNPRKPLSSYLYGVEALRDIKCIPDSVDLTRWDLFVPFREDDVTARRIAEARVSPPAIPIDVFKDHIYWAWTLRPENVVFTEEAVKRIRHEFVGLKDMMLSALPLIHRGYKETIARVSASFGVLYHNVNKKGRVEVTEEHVEKAVVFLHELIERFEHGVFVESYRSMMEISDEEWDELQGLLTGKILMTLQLIGKKPGVQISDLEQKLGVCRRTVLRSVGQLKGLDLVQSTKGRGGGYELNQKGVKVLRKLLGSAAAELTVGDKLRIVLGTVQKLQRDKGATRNEVANELEKRFSHDETIQLLQKLEEEGKIVKISLETGGDTVVRVA